MRILSLVLACLAVATPAWAQDEIYFPAVEDVATKLVERINDENVRIDMSVSLLTDRRISQAVANRFKAGVPVRLIGDRYSIFDVNDPARKTEFYWLASQGVPIRVRQNPMTYPELAHWKATIFVGQNVVSFGSANYTALELGPQSGAYSDQTVMFTDDVALVNAFKSEFDRMWSDQDRELSSIVGRPPYFLNWDDMCASEPACADYTTLHPTRTPMSVNTSRLEPNSPTPSSLVWSQGAPFNNRLVSAISAESNFIDIVVHRLTVENITDALLQKHAAGVPVRVIIEPNEYRNVQFPEFWLTAANIDRLHAAGVPVKQRSHAGLTHMKMLVTSSTATNASSNFSGAWQRDHNYFVSATAKPEIYTAMRDRFEEMWTGPGFATFTPLKPHAPVLQAPVDTEEGVSTNAALMWARTPFATRYDIYFGRSVSELTGTPDFTLDARLVNDPPKTYWWRPSLDPLTTYYWKVVARTSADLAESSAVYSFTTGEAAALTAAPSVIDLAAAGGSGTITVTATPGTAWSVTSDSPWLTVAPASGMGNGTLTYRAEYNDTATSRSAQVSINGVWIAIAQEADVAPGVPRLLTAALSPPNVQFTWQPPSSGGRAMRYQVEIASTAAFTQARFLQTDVGAAPTMRVSTLPPGEYYARVSALNGIGIGAPSDAVRFTMTAPPAGGGGGGGGTGGGGTSSGGSPAPTPNPGESGSPFAPRDVGAQVVGSRVAISWAPPRQGTALSYQVEAGLAPGRTDYVLPTTARSIAVTNVPKGIYYVRVRTVTAAGPTFASLEIAVGVGVAVGGPAPAAPTNFSAAVAGANVTLRWSPGVLRDALPTHYVLEAGLSPGASNAAVMQVGVQTVINVSAVPPGVYYVRVRAANGATLSAPSNEVIVVVR